MKPIRIMIADDHTLFREGLTRIFSLEEDLLVVGEASKGDEVAKLVGELRPDILLLDLRMPKANALRTIREISEKYPQGKILILTAFSDENEFIDLLKAGIKGYALKGIDSATLIQAIKTIQAGNLWFDRELPWADLGQKYSQTTQSGG
jgi:two-component system response regulator DegU